MHESVDDLRAALEQLRMVTDRMAEILGAQALEELRPHFERVLAGHGVEYEEQIRAQSPRAGPPR
jgi:hypothetical protein